MMAASKSAVDWGCTVSDSLLQRVLRVITSHLR